MELRRNTKAQSGFTLMELMIAVAILGIIAAIAVPSYLDYTRKARFSEIVKAAAPYKAAVSECIQKKGIGNVADCDAGANGIPNAVTSTVGHIASIAVADGVITATATATDGLNGETYVLTPSVSGSLVVWTPSGTGITSGLAST